MTDLDAIPDCDTGEPESGYLVGIKTPMDPTLFEPLPQTTDARTRLTCPRHPVRVCSIMCCPMTLLAALNILREAAGLEPRRDRSSPRSLRKRPPESLLTAVLWGLV